MHGIRRFCFIAALCFAQAYAFVIDRSPGQVHTTLSFHKREDNQQCQFPSFASLANEHEDLWNVTQPPRLDLSKSTIPLIGGNDDIAAPLCNETKCLYTEDLAPPEDAKRKRQEPPRPPARPDQPPLPQPPRRPLHRGSENLGPLNSPYLVDHQFFQSYISDVNIWFVRLYTGYHVRRWVIRRGRFPGFSIPSNLAAIPPEWSYWTVTFILPPWILQIFATNEYCNGFLEGPMYRRAIWNNVNSNFPSPGLVQLLNNVWFNARGVDARLGNLYERALRFGRQMAWRFATAEEAQATLIFMSEVAVFYYEMIGLIGNLLLSAYPLAPSISIRWHAYADTVWHNAYDGLAEYIGVGRIVGGQWIGQGGQQRGVPLVGAPHYIDMGPPRTVDENDPAYTITRQLVLNQNQLFFDIDAWNAQFAAGGALGRGSGV